MTKNKVPDAQKLFSKYRKLSWFQKWSCGKSFIQWTLASAPPYLFIFVLKSALRLFLYSRSIYWVNYWPDAIRVQKVQKYDNFLSYYDMDSFTSRNSWPKWSNGGFFSVQHLIAPLAVRFKKIHSLDLGYIVAPHGNLIESHKIMCCEDRTHCNVYTVIYI